MIRVQENMMMVVSQRSEWFILIQNPVFIPSDEKCKRVKEKRVKSWRNEIQH